MRVPRQSPEQGTLGHWTCCLDKLSAPAGEGWLRAARTGPHKYRGRRSTYSFDCSASAGKAGPGRPRLPRKRTSGISARTSQTTGNAPAVLQPFVALFVPASEMVTVAVAEFPRESVTATVSVVPP